MLKLNTKPVQWKLFFYLEVTFLGPGTLDLDDSSLNKHRKVIW